MGVRQVGVTGGLEQILCFLPNMMAVLVDQKDFFTLKLVISLYDSKK